jgi:hypothetical protein
VNLAIEVPETRIWASCSRSGLIVATIIGIGFGWYSAWLR